MHLWIEILHQKSKHFSIYVYVCMDVYEYTYMHIHIYFYNDMKSQIRLNSMISKCGFCSTKIHVFIYLFQYVYFV
jgi:hypothetical protein